MQPKFVICGLEHTGTTLVSELFRQIPGVDSGFECGVYLADSPATFNEITPFYQNMCDGWGITMDELDECRTAATYAEFFEKLVARSTSLASDTTEIFDKTPRYLEKLSAVADRCDSPIIVCYKDPRAIVYSDFKRSKQADFNEWYDAYSAAKLRYMSRSYDQFVNHQNDPRVTTVGLEELALNSRATMERMFQHVGKTFELGYAIISEIRYSNVKSRTVSADIAFEFRGKLDDAAQKRVMDDFGQCDAWVYR